MASSERFEKVGGGPGYIWGLGVGYLEYTVPARSDRRRVSEVIVRAHLQPVLPTDAKPENIKTRVTLFINGSDCGSRPLAALVRFGRLSRPLLPFDDHGVRSSHFRRRELTAPPCATRSWFLQSRRVRRQRQRRCDSGVREA